jgi:hypothetical protein
MDHALTRRGLLAGMGVAAGAAALGTGIGPAGAATPAASLAFGPTGLDPTALVAGLSYIVIDGSAFVPRDQDSGWPRNITNQGVALNAGGTLVAPIVLPVGAVLKQVTLYYLFPAGAALQATLMRKTFVGNYDAVAPPATLPTGPALQASVFDVTEPVNGTATYAMFVNTLDATQLVGGLLVGYVAPPSQSFFPLTKIKRVLDTRQSGGKLGPNEERAVTLGIPAGASAGVFNLTVTETEAAGYVATFPAQTTYPGNSSINWFGPDQNLANGVICAVDPTGTITIRGGVSKTHVVIDVQGYLM